MSTEIWITGILGLLGVVLGVVNYIWNVRLYSPRVKIRVSIIISSDPFASPQYCIQIVNISMINITIESINIGLKNKQQLFSATRTYSKEMPHYLEQGDSVSAYFDGQSIGEFLYKEFGKTKVRIRPFCKDATGKQYKDTWQIFNVKLMFVGAEENKQAFLSLLKKGLKENIEEVDYE